MKGIFRMLFTSVSLVHISSSAPSPAEIQVEKRQVVTSVVTEISSILGSAATGVASDSAVASSLFHDLVTALEQVAPTATPTSVPQAISIINSATSPSPSQGSFFENVVQLIANDFLPSNFVNSISGIVNDLNLIGPNSETNVNLRAPSSAVYPKKQSTDAPYSLTEAQLRQVIYIPPGFTYGQKPPAILVPGTGNTGYETFSENYIPLLTGVSYADPVWLNIPGQLLGDVQVNAEYVAYAINYISGISGNKNVSVLAWSQGNLDTQWALKYWPSTRNVVSDFISFSPDFHGTELAYILCPYLPELPCVPAVIQQEYNSKFVARLRENGGDSAYVPTTTIYSATDEIVEPQQGTGASAYINDARNVGVSNNELQVVCNGQPAGGVYDHAGTLFNALGYALAVDALTHSGPGEPSRLNLGTVCQEVVAPGLSLAQVLQTTGALLISAVSVLIYEPKMFNEPALMAYATS
ncbi:alpha/beta-hydrolase [Viridothelium virens]|uniref:Alpha/beta-hydrolase n=1 Tax=Viridothelium virens TaxID=1048519 RepID=A0A6A6HK61_VIRVR|nr:alpha/beta-hydrolase [Viridothelium virens]